MKTNGFTASFTFETRKSLPATSDGAVKRSKEAYSRVVAVDPGAQIPLVCYEKKTIGGEEAYSKYSAKNFFFYTRDYKRRAYSKRKTEKLENKFNADVKDKNPNLKDCKQYANTSKFYEYWFTKRWKVYVEDNKLVRNQTLDRYMRTEKAYEKIITKLFPKEEGSSETLILYGKGSEFMNVSNFRLKGCAKFSHDSLLKKMREKNIYEWRWRTRRTLRRRAPTADKKKEN